MMLETPQYAKAFLNLILARLPDSASLFERIGRQLTKEAE